MSMMMRKRNRKRKSLRMSVKKMSRRGKGRA
jgi:hypothetical protein